MGPLTSRNLSQSRGISPLHNARPFIRTVTNHPMPRPDRFIMFTQRLDLIQDFTHVPRARRGHTAETCSSSYGLDVRLGLLPTRPRDHAVTSGYRLRTEA